MMLPPAHIEIKENIDTLDGWEERPYDFGFINAIPHKGWHWLPFAGGAELEGHHFVTKLIQDGADVEVLEL